MYNDFIVKVYRYWEDNNGSRSWDGWYYSKVYAIDGNEFLVYDNGDMSAYNGEEDFCETGFNWVDSTATMDICGENGRQPIVEPLVPFDIVEFMADRKTENSSEKPNNCEPKICDTCRYYNSNIPCGSTPSACKEADKFAKEFVDGLKKLKPKVEPQFDKDINVRSKDEPQYSEDDMYWLSLAEDVANGKMSDAGANQAWLEYINHKDEPTISKMEQVGTMSCQECKHWNVYKGCRERVCKYEPKDEPQTDCAWR